MLVVGSTDLDSLFFVRGHVVVRVVKGGQLFPGLLFVQSRSLVRYAHDLTRSIGLVVILIRSNSRSGSRGLILLVILVCIRCGLHSTFVFIVRLSAHPFISVVLIIRVGFDSLILIIRIFRSLGYLLIIVILVLLRVAEAMGKVTEPHIRINNAQTKM